MIRDIDISKLETVTVLQPKDYFFNAVGNFDLKSGIFGKLDESTLLLKFTPDLILGIDEIDSQHRRLIKLLNETNHAIIKGGTKWIVGSLMQEMLEYFDYHFHYEEKLMSQYCYEDSMEHKAAHQNLINTLRDLKKSFEANVFPSSEQKFMEKVKDMLSVQILILDRPLCEYLKNIVAARKS